MTKTHKNNLYAFDPSGIDMHDRVLLVTGASRGLGKALALAAAHAGAHVVLASRHLRDLEPVYDAITATGAGATLAPFDLQDQEPWRKLGSMLDARFSKLDGLFANAAILGELCPLSDVTTDIWNRVMHVNVTANLRLVQSLDTLLKRASSPRVVFVTSAAAQNCRSFWGPYSISKAALNALALTYAREVCTHPDFKVNLLDPGPMATAMRAQAMPGEDPATLVSPDNVAPLALYALSSDVNASASILSFKDWSAARAS